MQTLPLKILTADAVTLTGRIYPKEVLQHAIEEFNSRNEPCLCNNQGLSNNHVELDEITHEVQHLELNGNDLIATVRFLDTPRGNMLQKLIDVLGLDKFKVYPAGIGTLKNRKIVNDGYIFTGIVIQPTGE